MKANHRDLLVAWIEQGRPLPTTDKIQTFLQLLTIQEKRAGCDLDPDLVLAVIDSFTELVHLVNRNGNGAGFYWQTLQAPAKETPAMKKLKKVKEKKASPAEQIYQAYPRHIGKAAAIKAINAAIKKLGQLDPTEDAAAFLLERTKAFAVSPKGNLGQFTPYPATFYNQGRYADDEAEWGVTENRKWKPETRHDRTGTRTARRDFRRLRQTALP